MHCPFCQAETKVLDSRLTSEGQVVRRRRECLKCSFRFSTLEESRILDLTIIKQNGQKEPYDRNKIIRGLEIALRKRKYTPEAFQKLVREIEMAIQKLKSNEVESTQMGEIIMDKLKKFDKVGYIRFASVYRQFEDVQTFEDEIKKLNKTKKK